MFCPCLRASCNFLVIFLGWVMLPHPQKQRARIMVGLEHPTFRLRGGDVTTSPLLTSNRFFWNFYWKIFRGNSNIEWKSFNMIYYSTHSDDYLSKKHLREKKRTKNYSFFFISSVVGLRNCLKLLISNLLKIFQMYNFKKMHRQI